MIDRILYHVLKNYYFGIFFLSLYNLFCAEGDFTFVNNNWDFTLEYSPIFVFGASGIGFYRTSYLGIPDYNVEVEL